MTALPFWACGILALGAASADVQDRFPRPEFETPYRAPETPTPPPRSLVLEYLDVGVLAAALGAAAFFAIRRPSRPALFGITIFSVAYFGFWREGCVCPVGSIQNVALGIAGGGDPVPLIVILFFLLPLLFALLFGRVFCAAVCPLGAIQEVALVRPVEVPGPVAHFLSLLPYVYLGTAVLLAAVGAEFLICRFDPFVGFFRMGGPFGMIVFGGALLLLATVVGRPYCRFLCPYGVLLKWASHLSKFHLTTTPSQCIQCRLCEGSCPYGALLAPTPLKEPERSALGERRLGAFLALLPVLVAAGAGLGVLVHGPLSRIHPEVDLAERVALEGAGKISGTTDASRAFYESKRPVEDLAAAARGVRTKVRTGAAVVGGFLGLVLGAKLIALSVRRRRTEYRPHRGDCFSCARCTSYCSIGRNPGARLDGLRSETAASGGRR